MINLEAPQRQSPLAIVFLALRVLRSIGIAQLAIAALFLARAPLDGPLLAVPFIAIALFGLVSALSWWRYTFQLVDGELIVVKGVISVDRLTVPVDRIQSLSIDQELLHRITGLVKVSVDTAGSAATEFSIDAIARPVAEELQRLAVTTTVASTAPDVDRVEGAPPPPAPPEDQVIFTHDAQRLVRTALTMWPLTGLIVLGPFVAFGDQFSRQLSDRFGDIEIDTSRFQWWWLPIGAGAFLIFSVVLNIARLLLQEWQLTLRANPTSLRRTSGLLSRTSKASSVSRVQVVTTAQNVLQQRVGLASVELSTIGEGDLRLVGCDQQQVDVVRELAGSRSDAPLDRRIHPAEIFLAVRNTAVAMTLVAATAWFIVGWWALLVYAVVALTWFTQRRHVANFRWSLGPELATYSRVFDATTQQALLRKTNAVHVTQSMFQRRRDLARVHLITAAGSVSVGMVPVAEANAVRDLILAAAESDHRPWM